MKKIKEKFKAGDEVHGFCFDRVVPVPVINAIFHEYHHIATGAKGIHIYRDDIVNVFSAMFKTIPFDSTGWPHILEHSVLTGSKKFPLKEPFAILLRTSPNAFLNAMTWPDKTAYPAASAYDQDLRNLREVYCDAAFAPLLLPETFSQEGWHYEFDEKGKLIRKGVVLNEMRDAMVIPTSIMEEAIANALFPTTTYRFNSGGDPDEIPKLTYKEFMKNYERDYHLSNAYIYSYGPYPLSDHLAFLEKEYFKNQTRLDMQNNVYRESRWQKPRAKSVKYPLANEDPKKKYQHAIAWLTAPVDNPDEILALDVLSDVLINSSAAPLRKALIDSGLGSDLADCSGLDADYRDAVFSVGLKDIYKKDIPKVEDIVFSALRKLAAKGIDKELIEMTLHQFEFAQKEAKSRQGAPYGLKLFLQMAGTWIHGGDPIKFLDITGFLDDIREKASKGSYFENLIKKYLLDNAHRVHLILEPDPNMLKRKNEKDTQELAQIHAHLTQQEKDKIIKNTKKLKKHQEKEEDTSCVKIMGLDDMPEQMRKALKDRGTRDSSLSLYTRPTNDIFYFNTAFGGSKLSERLVQYMPLFCDALIEIGTKVHDYSELARLIKLNTGGIQFGLGANTKFSKSKQCLPIINMRGKCFSRKQSEMHEILRELIKEYDFYDLKRLKEIILENKSSMEKTVINAGHFFAKTLACRGFDATHWLNEYWGGIHAFLRLKDMESRINRSKNYLGEIADCLQETGEILFNRKNMRVALTGEEGMLARGVELLTEMKAGLSTGAGGFGNFKLKSGQELFREGWITDMQGSHSACAFKPIHMDHVDAPAIAVIIQMLARGLFWEEIRVKGGAYGGMANYNPYNGTITFLSYRDPNIVNTQEVFDGAYEFIRKGKYTDKDIANTKIVMYESYNNSNLSLNEITAGAFMRDQILISDRMRDKYWEKIRKVTREDMIRAAEHLKYENASVAVISNEQMLEKANQELEQMGEEPLMINKI